MRTNYLAEIGTMGLLESSYEESDSFQLLAADLTLQAGAGHSTAYDSSYLAAGMGNVLADEALTETRAIIAGLIGKFTIETCASLLPKAGLIGETASGAADAAVLALLSDGDGFAAPTPRAMFGVAYMTGSVENSKADLGLDLKGAGGIAEADAVSYGTADICFSSGGLLYTTTEAITANVTTTSLAAGTLGKTTHATGRASLFVSDGTKWQFLTNT